MVQGGKAEAHRLDDGLPLRLVPGGVPPGPELPEEQAPEGVLPGAGPDVRCHPGVVPDFQGVEPPGQGRLQGLGVPAALPGLSGEEYAVKIVGRVPVTSTSRTSYRRPAKGTKDRETLPPPMVPS